MLKKLLLPFLLILFSCSWADTRYFYAQYNGNANDCEWTNSSNWYTDAGMTTPLGGPAISSDDVVILPGSCLNTPLDTSTWIYPQSLEINTTGNTFTFVGTISFPINGTADLTLGGGDITEPIVARNISFGSGSNDSTITADGTVTFDGVVNNGIVNGNTVFQAGSTNNGVIQGNVTFDVGSTNNGTVVNNNIAYISEDGDIDPRATLYNGILRTYTSNAVTIKNFSINGINTYEILADNAEVDVTNATYNTNSSYFPLVTFTAVNGGSFIGLDQTLPTLTSITSDVDDGTYGIGDTIDIDVIFSEAVTSDGNISITLETGTVDRVCTFTISNNDRGTCDYVVQSGDNAIDLSVSEISGIILDHNGNINDLSLNDPFKWAGNQIDNLENNKNIVIVTPIIPLYWYNSGGDNQWNTLTGNWWTDINHTIQVSSLPNSSNSIIITGPVGPVVDLNSWQVVNSINSSTVGITFHSPSPTDNDISVPIQGNATFTGNAHNYGAITGNVIFRDNSGNNNSGTINGNVTFYDSSFNLHQINGDATFYDNSYSGGTVSGVAQFMYISGSTVTVGQDFIWKNTVFAGSIIGSDGQTPTSWVFNNNSQNNGYITGNAIFNGTSKNNGRVTGNAIFNENSQNDIPYTGLLGLVTGNATFNGASRNYGEINNATFNGTSQSITGSSILGNAVFNDSSVRQSGVTIVGTSQFACGTSNLGVITCANSGGGSSIVITDNIKPKITHLRTEFQQNSQYYSASVLFSVDENVSVQVLSASSGTSTFIGSQLSSYHGLYFQNLDTCIPVNYSLLLRDTSNNTLSYSGSFVTPGCPYPIEFNTMLPSPKEIDLNNFSLPNISFDLNNAVNISFTAVQPGRYEIQYGLTREYDNFVDTNNNDQYAVDRFVTLENLSFCNTYFYQLISIDTSIVSPHYSFVYGDGTCPVKIQPIEILPEPIDEIPLKHHTKIITTESPEIEINKNISNNNSILSVTAQSSSSGNASSNGYSGLTDLLLSSTVTGPLNPLPEVIDTAESTSEKYQILSFSITNTKKYLTDVYKKPVVQKTLQQTKESFVEAAQETVVAAQYSLVLVSVLLGGLFVALNIMIMGSTWTTYTIQEGDTLAVVASRFNMFESILLRQNSLSGANSLVPGTVLKVKNRPFLDKNYLNKLKDVLNVLSEKRKHIFTH